MGNNLKDRMANLFSSSAQSISLETVFKDRDVLITQHVEQQNKIACFVAGAIVLLANVFWTFINGSGKVAFGLTTVYGVTGLILTSIVSILAIVAVIKTKGQIQSKAFNIALHSFRYGLILGVMALDIARSMSIAKAGMGSMFNGLPLSALLLIILVFVPTRRKRDSIILIALMLICAILPKLICPSGTYLLTEQLVLRLSLIVGFFAFRGLTIRNAMMIEDLADASYLDFQTKTLNRKALSEYMEGLAAKDFSSIGVLKYDIDDFKSFNDEYSHSKGDEVLKSVCEKASEVLESENALIFRYGSGEFIAMMLDISDENLVKCALRIRDAVQDMHLERKDATWRDYVTVTIGCTSASKDELDERDLLGDVDTQLFIGKRGTKNCVVFRGRIFITEGEISAEQEPTQYTDRVAQAITEAMKNNEIVAYYQPLYDTMTQKLVGAEALSRWVKSDGTVILPGEYIPELEKNSSILALDWYMYRQVCRMLKEQKDRGIRQVRISVNFSRMHALYERSIEKRLCEIADSYGVPHNLIEIEITESAYIRLPNIIEPYIKAIRAEGFAVAVDDFGSGASSLGFVKSVDVDTLKIDKSLISSNCEDEKERVLLESVVYLAHRLELVSVAEGVETQEQLGFLKSLRCSHIQGFIFARPMPEEDFFKACLDSDDGSEDDGRRPSEDVKDTPIQLLIDSVFGKYPMAIMANITNDSYYAKTHGSFIDHNYAQSGKVTSLLAEMSATMHPAYVSEFNRLFSLESQLDAFKRGESKISFRTLLHGDNDLSYKEVEISSFFVKEQSLDDVFVITLCSEV